MKKCRGGDGSAPDAGQVTRAHIRRGVDGSLARLQTDYIDLYQLHWPSRYVPMFGRSRFNPEERREEPGFEVVVKVRPAASAACGWGRTCGHGRRDASSTDVSTDVTTARRSRSTSWGCDDAA